MKYEYRTLYDRDVNNLNDKVIEHLKSGWEIHEIKGSSRLKNNVVFYQTVKKLFEPYNKVKKVSL